MRRFGHRHEPSFPPRPGLDPVQAPVDQDAREPDLERQLLPKRLQVRIRLDQRILHRLVRLRRIAQVVKRNPGRAPLMASHQLGVPLARLGVATLGLQRLDRGGSDAVGFAAGEARGLSSCHLITLPGSHRLPDTHV